MMTDAELEFMRHHRFMALVAGDPDRRTASDTATAAGELLVQRLVDEYPSRTERLLVLSRLELAVRAARGQLLDELIDGEVTVSTKANGKVSGLGLQPYDFRPLASLAGVTEGTVRRRVAASMEKAFERVEAENLRRVQVTGSALTVDDSPR